MGTVMKKFVWSVLALGLSTAPALAQTPAPVPPSVEVGGLVDVYYDYYSTNPDVGGAATYRNFDTKHNQFALSMAEVWLAKAPTASSRVGFKFKLNFGPAATDYIHCCEPGGSTYQNIQEAYASYLAPVGKGLQIDAGVFVTPAGAEVIEAKDNANYSRGLLFSLAIPYYHSGVRVNYPLSDKVSLMGGVVNGWNNIVENNTGKTLISGVTIKPTSSLSVVGNYIAGPEQSGSNDEWRHLFDGIVTLQVMPTLSVMANYDYGHETTGGTNVQWQGIAGYLKFQPTAAIAFSPRLEFFNDEDGFTTGHMQKLKEVTGTVELKASDSLQWRIEYRRDWSDVSPFVNAKGEAKDNQQSIGFGLLYSFAGKTQ
jgi:hypothetical protein